MISEDELLTCVIECLRLFHWRYFHIRNSKAGIVQGNVGFPDLVAVRDGRIVVAELKSERGDLTADQRAWLEDWEFAGARVYVWRPSDWQRGEIEAVLR